MLLCASRRHLISRTKRVFGINNPSSRSCHISIFFFFYRTQQNQILMHVAKVHPSCNRKHHMKACVKRRSHDTTTDRQPTSLCFLRECDQWKEMEAWRCRKEKSESPQEKSQQGERKEIAGETESSGSPTQQDLTAFPFQLISVPSSHNAQLKPMLPPRLPEAVRR